jgi:hypothetical protein
VAREEIVRGAVDLFFRRKRAARVRHAA